MANQQTHRELVNALVQVAYSTGQFVGRGEFNTQARKRAIKDRNRLDNEVVDRLVIQSAQLDRLKDEIADLKHERNTLIEPS